MTVTNVTRKTVLADKCEVASTFFARFRGLQFRKELPPGHGLLITPCNSIHMFFMRFPIDALFIDSENRIVHIYEGIKPWRVSGIIKNAHCVLELPSGTVYSTGTVTGDLLDMQP
ncbi:MAG TPA: DUF192 domain-containing protein [Clostridiales bacterium]|nr:DUF192 domain-containing protein [Clostridiales bacterium]